MPSLDADELLRLGWIRPRDAGTNQDYQLPGLGYDVWFFFQGLIPR